MASLGAIYFHTWILASFLVFYDTAVGLIWACGHNGATEALATRGCVLAVTWLGTGSCFWAATSVLFYSLIPCPSLMPSTSTLSRALGGASRQSSESVFPTDKILPLSVLLSVFKWQKPPALQISAIGARQLGLTSAWPLLAWTDQNCSFPSKEYQKKVGLCSTKSQMCRSDSSRVAVVWTREVVDDIKHLPTVPNLISGGAGRMRVAICIR